MQRFEHKNRAEKQRIGWKIFRVIVSIQVIFILLQYLFQLMK